MNIELARQHENYRAVRTRLWDGRPMKPKQIKRFVMRMPEWMVKQGHFDAHMNDWRRFMGSKSKVHIAIRASHFGLSASDITGGSRKRNIVHARHIIAYELVKFFGKSYPEVGRLLGGLDHTSCIHAVKKIERMLSSGEIDAKDLNI